MLFLAIVLLAFYITKPFLPSLLTGAIIAYLSYPLYRKTLNYTKNKSLAAFIVSVFIVLLFTIPFIIIFGLVSSDAVATYKTLNSQNFGSNFLQVVCQEKEWLSCKSVKYLIALLPNNNLDYYIQSTVKAITTFIIDNTLKFLSSVPEILLNFFVMIFVVYYALKDGEIIGARIKNLLPLKESHKQHVTDTFHEITNAAFYGTLFIAIIQGILGGIGFFVLGIGSPVLWGFLMILFSMIPYFGTAIVWVPAGLNLVFIGYLQNDYSFTFRGVVLLVYGVLIVSVTDFILKPRIIGTKTKVHPILVLLGILGGLNLFGFIGLVIGPVMLALLMTFIDVYEDEKGELEKYF